MMTKAKTGKAIAGGGVVALAAGLVGTTVLVSQLAAETPESASAGQQQRIPAYHYTGPANRDLSQDWFDGVRDRDDQAARGPSINAPPANWRRLINEVDGPTATRPKQAAGSNLPSDDGWVEYEQIALGGLAGIAITAVVASGLARRRRHLTEREEGEVGATDLDPGPDQFRASEFDFSGEILESPRRGGR